MDTKAMLQTKSSRIFLRQSCRQLFDNIPLQPVHMWWIQSHTLIHYSYRHFPNSIWTRCAIH